MGAWDMATPFDSFLATQGRMRANEAQGLENQMTLAKLGQIERAQKMQDDTLLALKNQQAPKSLQELGKDAPDAASERGEPTPPPKQKSAGEQVMMAADEADRLAKTLQSINPAEAEKQRRERDNLWLKAAPLLKEERLAKIEEGNIVNQWMGAVKDDLTLNAVMGQIKQQKPELYKAWTEMRLPNGAPAFQQNLDGSFAYTPQTQKIAEAVSNASMKRSEQLAAEDRVADNRRADLELQRKKEADAEKVRSDKAKEGLAREGVEIKKTNLAQQRSKNDPFGIFSSGPEITTTSDGSRAATGVTLDSRTGRMYKDGLDVTDQLKTGSVTTADPQALKAALGSNKHGDEFLKLVPPGLQTTVLQIAEGRGPMPPQGRNDPTNKAIRAMVNQYDPNYREGDYASGAAAEKAFTAGRLGSSVRSFNVATQHLDTLQKAADALQNGDVPAFNAAGNYLAKQTGKPAPTDFNATKKIVADEIVKAIVGGQNALADRQEVSEAVNAANSPAQLVGVINKYKELMGGQLVGLEKQYEASTKKKDFRERFLTPEANKEMGKFAPSGSHPADIQSLLKKYGG